MAKTCPKMSNTDVDIECEEIECGWWDKNNNQCIVLTIGYALGNR